MSPEVQFVFPKPGKALVGMMAVMAALWVVFAVGTNWAGAGDSVLSLLVGSNEVFRGQVWRLLTAPLIHAPNDPGHLITSVLGLYFLGTSLEERWGPKRMLGFLMGASAFAYAVQLIVGVLVPSLAAPVWFGGLGMIEAVAVAWALAFRGQQVRLFFVLPVTSTMLLMFIFGMSVLNVFARRSPAEGLVTPFGGMLAGYLLGDTSPLRRYFLQSRLRRLERQAVAMRSGRRVGGAPFRVIEGGDKKPPRDKRYLN